MLDAEHYAACTVKALVLRANDCACSLSCTDAVAVRSTKAALSCVPRSRSAMAWLICAMPCDCSSIARVTSSISDRTRLRLMKLLMWQHLVDFDLDVLHVEKLPLQAVSVRGALKFDEHPTAQPS